MKPAGWRALTLAVAVLAAPASRAAEIELSGLIGFRAGGEVENVGIDPRRDSGLDPGLTLGIAVEFPLRPHGWLTVFWSHEETEFDGGDLFTGVRDIGLDIDYFHFGGVYRPRREGGAQPFVMMSAGLTSYRPQGSGFDNELGVSLAAAGGARFKLGPRTSLRLEARGYVTLEDAAFTGQCGPASCTFGLSGSGAFQFEALTGVAYAF